MKEKRRRVSRSIRHKIFNLVLITIILIMAAYTAVIAYQSGKLTDIVRSANDSQRESISSVSKGTMAAVLDANLIQSTQMEAYIAGDVFGDASRVVKIVADYTGKLLADPENYPIREVAPPDMAKDGQISLQVLTEEGVDVSSPAIRDKLGVIGNLTELMTAVYADANVDSCYVALPEGVMLLVDNHSSSKFDGDGNIIPIPIHERKWYTGAAEAGDLYYTDVTSDLYTGEISIMCSLPVYSDGELVAVVGADLFLNDVSAAVNSTAKSGSFICIVNRNGHVLFSPQKEGVFRVLPADEA
ncbi:MAG: cache domain-containing protein, partial [Clostridia bacterium]|nr:cache domain-containing protein [Clostridia bacterium]